MAFCLVPGVDAAGLLPATVELLVAQLVQPAPDAERRRPLHSPASGQYPQSLTGTSM